MPTNLQKHFVPALYVVLGLLLALNMLALVSGRLLALLPLAVQFAVLGSVYLRKSWSYIAVKLWALVVMLSGVAMWLAVLLDGTAYFHSVPNAVFNTFMLLAGFYFFKFAKPALQQVRDSI